jgi:hypothetical protein
MYDKFPKQNNAQQDPFPSPWNAHTKLQEVIIRRSLSPHITTYHHMHTPQSSKRPRRSPGHLFAGAGTANHLKSSCLEGRLVERQGFFVYGVQAEAVSAPEANFLEVG